MKFEEIAKDYFENHELKDLNLPSFKRFCMELDSLQSKSGWVHEALLDDVLLYYHKNIFIKEIDIREKELAEEQERLKSLNLLFD